MAMTLTVSYAQGPVEPSVQELTIGQTLQNAANECPDRVAVIVGAEDPSLRRQWTYAELYDEAMCLAHRRRRRTGRPQGMARCGSLFHTFR